MVICCYAHYIIYKCVTVINHFPNNVLITVHLMFEVKYDLYLLLLLFPLGRGSPPPTHQSSPPGGLPSWYLGRPGNSPHTNSFFLLRAIDYFILKLIPKVIGLPEFTELVQRLNLLLKHQELPKYISLKRLFSTRVQIPLCRTEVYWS